MKKRTGYGRLRGDTGHHRRIMATMAVLGVLAFGPVIWRLYDLMVTNYDYYAGLALRNQSRTTAVSPRSRTCRKTSAKASGEGWEVLGIRSLSTSFS